MPPIVKVTWLDATYNAEESEELENNIKQGGAILVSVGFLHEDNKKCICLAGELNEDGTTSRDFTVIPKGMIIKKEIIHGNKN